MTIDTANPRLMIEPKSVKTICLRSLVSLKDTASSPHPRLTCYSSFPAACTLLSAPAPEVWGPPMMPSWPEYDQPPTSGLMPFPPPIASQPDNQNVPKWPNTDRDSLGKLPDFRARLSVQPAPRLSYHTPHSYGNYGADPRITSNRNAYGDASGMPPQNVRHRGFGRR